MRERYKAYCRVLEGKQMMEQYVNAFELKEPLDKYINYKGEKEDFWIYNTTRIIMDRDAYRTHIYDREEYIKGSYSYSLYLHKTKDMVVLTAPIVTAAYGIQYEYNLFKYFKYRFKAMGFNMHEIINKKSMFGSHSQFCVVRAKILIKPDVTEDDLQLLLFFIEKLNNFIMDNSPNMWEDTKSVLQKVDPHFVEYVKKTDECTYNILKQE